MSDWFVYMVRCDGGPLYTGITTDPERRMEEHRTGRGAAFFRIHKPLEMRVIETCPDRSVASSREAAIKKLTRQQKEELFQ